MEKRKKLIRALCFIMVLGVVLVLASNLFERKDGEEYYSEFWENPGEYDVWFMGTSHVFYSINPMELWEQYGIRSYDLAAPESRMPQTYWTLKCALQYGKPKVIVLDTYKVQASAKHQREQEKIHIGMDGVPLSPMKIKGIFDIFETWRERFEYICNFSIYHNRWGELKKDDFCIQRQPMKGARLQDHIYDRSNYRLIAKNEMSDTDTTGFLYLEKIIEECEKQGIELILTEIPFCGMNKVQRAMNAVPKVANEHGLTCLNMVYEKDLLDYGVDFGDIAHVNLFGSKKITKYVGDYLSKHCNLTDYRESAEIAEKWNDDYEVFLQYKTEMLKGAEEIESYVQWLLDDRYTCYMYHKREPGRRLARELAQLENLTYISKEKAEEMIGGKIKGENAFVVKNESGEVVDTAIFHRGERR